MTTLQQRRARAAKGGEAAAALVNPKREVARTGSGGTVRDHAAANRALLREVQRANREERDAAQERDTKEAFKMQRFRAVESVVFKDNPTKEKFKATGAGEGEGKGEFLRKGTRVMAAEAKAEAAAAAAAAAADDEGTPTTAPRRVKTKPPVPRASEPLPPLSSDGVDEKNFIRENAREVVAAGAAGGGARRAASAGATSKHDDYGKVPSYLLERKLEWAEAEEAKRAAAEAAKVPVGFVLLTDEKRLETLKLLKANAAALENELSRFPLVVETASRRRAKDDLMQRLTEVEQAIDKFSKKTVYITA